MRIEIELQPTGGVVPLRNSHPLAAALYGVLNDPALHDDQRIKPFSVHPLRQRDGKPEKATEGLLFRGPTTLTLGCQTLEILEKFMTRLKPGSTLRLGEAGFRVRTVLPTPTPSFREACLWRPVGFITTHQWDGERAEKTHMSPDQNYEATRTALIENLRKKTRQYAPELTQAPLAVEIDASQTRKTVVFFGGRSSAPAWKADVLVVAPPEIQALVWNLGLGSGNAMGLGGAQLKQTQPVPA